MQSDHDQPGCMHECHMHVIKEILSGCLIKDLHLHASLSCTACRTASFCLCMRHCHAPRAVTASFCLCMRHCHAPRAVTASFCYPIHVPCHVNARAEFRARLVAILGNNIIWCSFNPCYNKPSTFVRTLTNVHTQLILPVPGSHA